MAAKTTNRIRKSKKRNRKTVLILAIVLAVLVMTLLALLGSYLYQRWDARYESETSVIFIEKDGRVVTNDVIAFDMNQYSATELEIFVDRTIADFCTEYTEGAVTKKSLVVEDGIASLILIYQDAKTYHEFTDLTLFAGSLAEAVEAGYDFEAEFADVRGESPLYGTKDAFMEDPEWKVVVVKSNTRVEIDGKIGFLSTEGIAEYGRDYVVIRPNGSCLEAPDTEEESTAAEDGTETDTETGAEADVSEEESSGPKFDFGEEETEIIEDTDSEVYTYIIYK